MDSVGLIAAGIAHNFNNLLQVIMGNIYMAKLDVASEQQLALIEEAESAGQRASEIVRQLRLSVHPNLPKQSPLDQSCEKHTEHRRIGTQHL